MEISDGQIRQLIVAILEDAAQACRVHGRMVGEKLDEGPYKQGYLQACDHLGVDNIIKEHVRHHTNRILSHVRPSGKWTKRGLESSKRIHETTLSPRLKKVLYRAGFETIKDLKQLSRYRFLTFYRSGETTLKELEQYLNRPLSDAVFSHIPDEKAEDRHDRYKQWLSEN